MRFGACTFLLITQLPRPYGKYHLRSVQRRSSALEAPNIFASWHRDQTCMDLTKVDPQRQSFPLRVADMEIKELKSAELMQELRYS